MTSDLADYGVLSFDCYGTIIDWETGLWSALRPLFEANGARPDRSEVLTSYGELEAEQEAATPTLSYPEVLSSVHHRLAIGLGLETSEEMDHAFGSSVPSWPAFADSADALRRLGERYRLVILSNVDRAGFAASNRLLGIEFDAVHTAEDIGSYKPDPENFDYLLRHVEHDFGVSGDSVLHVAQSLFHDHAPAKAAGIETVWIDRQRLSAGGAWGATKRVDDAPEPDHVYYSMAELADAVESA